MSADKWNPNDLPPKVVAEWGFNDTPFRFRSQKRRFAVEFLMDGAWDEIPPELIGPALSALLFEIYEGKQTLIPHPNNGGADFVAMKERAEKAEARVRELVECTV